MMHQILTPERRTALIEAYTFHAPQVVKSWTSERIGLPLRPEVRKAGLIFVHVPKNAGTTVSTDLYGGHIGHRSALFYRACDPVFFASVPSFAILREPIERFLSAYVFSLNGGSKSVPASAAAQKFAARFDNALACARHVAAIGAEARDRLDPVFRSQAHYVCDENGTVIVGHLLRIDQLQQRGADIGRYRVGLAEKRNAGKEKPAVTEDLAEAVRVGYPEDVILWENTA